MSAERDPVLGTRSPGALGTEEGDQQNLAHAECK